MSELEDFELEPSALPEGRKRPIWPYGVALGLVAIALGVYFGFFFRRGPEAAPPLAQEAPAVAPVLTDASDSALDEVAPLELPPLEESDELVRGLVAGISSHPELASWLVTDGLIRRLAVVVDNVAEGVSPRTHLGFLEPEGGFSTVERGGYHYTDPAGYRRYDLLASAIASLDARGSSQLYRNLRPLIQEAYVDLGYPNREFESALARAFRMILETPLLPAHVELSPGVRSYEFADPGLEDLSEAQKHLLRMGPDNLRKIQEKVREIALSLELEEVPLP